MQRQVKQDRIKRKIKGRRGSERDSTKHPRKVQEMSKLSEENEQQDKQEISKSKMWIPAEIHESRKKESSAQ